MPTLSLAPDTGDDGQIVDTSCTAGNAAAVAYVDERLPGSPAPRWSGPVSLHGRLPSLFRRPVPEMISRAGSAAGPVRLIAEVRGQPPR
ncbi:hypothetical protein [Streptomyces mutabilis]|uniref:Uncharacterized protein n=1 Tax=Streptomyces mutabilis TaxID=67332 RepID=A0A086MXL1_9ACTN|nr:hypothetical protein [Streptomyces mutabilis]KFG73629.1 hypothetical protein FM21_22815 [Streptomyces mutabilis]